MSFLELQPAGDKWQLGRDESVRSAAFDDWVSDKLATAKASGSVDEGKWQNRAALRPAGASGSGHRRSGAGVPEATSFRS